MQTRTQKHARPHSTQSSCGTSACGPHALDCSPASSTAPARRVTKNTGRSSNAQRVRCDDRTALGSHACSRQERRRTRTSERTTVDARRHGHAARTVPRNEAHETGSNGHRYCCTLSFVEVSLYRYTLCTNATLNPSGGRTSAYY